MSCCRAGIFTSRLRRALLQASPPRGSYLSAGLSDLPVADFERLRRVGRFLQGGLQLRLGRRGIDAFGRNRAVGEDRDDIVGNLHEPAIDVVDRGLSTG